MQGARQRAEEAATARSEAEGEVARLRDSLARAKEGTQEELERVRAEAEEAAAALKRAKEKEEEVRTRLQSCFTALCPSEKLASPSHLFFPPGFAFPSDCSSWPRHSARSSRQRSSGRRRERWSWRARPRSAG